ncbi:lytic transglycosylase domain-containing protein [Xenorhabdus bovienii]|uniref:Putative transglycosylase PilT n=1 Tax=Xenorhabdus bovienii str. feltiae Moldova TaxID=1398200 RepID=A0A077NJI1_XENBV|nr:lytic transglycosylase domain-containing protein [Xenorhabdus bovienii]MCG3471857.1 lytic transglycosylase domain-containing protein [Xenorhabdus bovienii]CDH02247.1 putative transglycosylase PilT [Xenorhabdus bovienii str. feltiae Moldova]
MRKLILASLFSSFFIPLPSYSFMGCFISAGQQYGVSPLLIQAIAEGESKYNNRAINLKNSDGTTDATMMQINSWWHDKPVFIKNKLSRQKLMKDPCLSINFGAWVLAGNFSIGGVNWNSVGAYNAGWDKGKATARQNYVNRIKLIYERLKRESGVSPSSSEMNDSNLGTLTAELSFPSPMHDKSTPSTELVTKSFFHSRNSDMKLVGDM